jgi:hypothetical protein
LEAKRKKQRSEKYQKTIEHTTLLPFSELAPCHRSNFFGKYRKSGSFDLMRQERQLI